MSGSLRFSLAILVVLSHLVASTTVQYFGFYSVRAFFVLSGFAMTAALNQTYHFDFVRYFANRILRLLPNYLLVCVATACLISIYPTQAADFMPRWGFKPSLIDIVQNAAIIPLVFHGPNFRFMEQGWSIAIELIMYVLLYIGMARSLRAAALCFIVGAVYHAVMLFMGAPFSQRYYSIAAALLSFSLGSMIFFWVQIGVLTPRTRMAVAAALAWLTHLLAADLILPSGYAETGGYYVGIFLSVLVVAHLPAFAVGSNMQKLDRMLGRLSYPVYLVQWLGAFLAHVMLCPNSWRGWDMAAAGLPVILGLAAMIVWVDEAIVEPLRRRVRDGLPEQTFTSLLTLEIRSSIEFASRKPNQSWIPPRKAA